MTSSQIFAILLFSLGALQALALWILSGIKDDIRDVRGDLAKLQEAYLNHLGEHVAQSRDAQRLETDLEKLKTKYVETLEILARLENRGGMGQARDG